MARVSRPKQGCFKASYPNMEWQEVPCTTERKKRPYAPRPQTVGNGNDFMAEVTGRITSATGSFDTVAGLTSVTGVDGATNSYSLQLNTNLFDTPICDGASEPRNCRGWQQFIFTNQGEAFMQYWLINYGDTCPDQTNWGSRPPNCFTSSHGVFVPPQPIANLAQLKVTGTATADGYDNVSLATADEIYSVDGDRNILFTLVERDWNRAEFNVLGDCCSSEARFNDGSMMAVRVSVDYGSQEAPRCYDRGTTGETNNLNLVPPCCSYGGAAPAIVFWQSNNHPEAGSICARTERASATRILLTSQASCSISRPRATSCWRKLARISLFTPGRCRAHPLGQMRRSINRWH
jgi:hypothetical protein